jgi:uncharacterized protein YbjT (DUF2867 family)
VNGHILVVGATGSVGGAVARALRDGGDPVRVLARSATARDALAAQGFEVLDGDLRDGGSMARAVAGAATLILTATGARGDPGNGPAEVDDQGARRLLEEARRAGVRRVVAVTAANSDPGSAHALLRAKAAEEAHLAVSGLTWTAIAPEMFMDSWIPAVVTGPAARGEAVVLPEGAPAQPLIAADDVAAAVLLALGQDWTAGRRLPLGGPELADWEAVVDGCARHLGKTLGVVRLDPAEIAVRGDHLSHLLVEPRTPHAEELDIARRLGIRLQRVESWLAARGASQIRMTIAND